MFFDTCTQVRRRGKYSLCGAGVRVARHQGLLWSVVGIAIAVVYHALVWADSLAHSHSNLEA